MSRLQDLITELCPDGVEYKALEEVAAFGGGHTPSKAVSSNYEENGIWWVTSKDVKTDVLTSTGITLSASGASGLTCYPEGTLVMVTRSGVLKRMLPIAFLAAPMTVNQDIKAILPTTEIIEPKYLFHVLKSSDAEIRERYGKVGGTVDSVNFKMMKKHRIPVPPIEVQREVVHILDEYTMAYDDLVHQLEYELVLHEQQLSIARNQLLTFTENVRWTTLGELGSFYGGLTGKTKNDFGNGMPFVTYMQVYANAALPSEGFERVAIGKGERQNAIALGDVLITISSENLEDAGMTCVVTQAPDEVTYLNSFCTGWRPNDAKVYYPNFLKHLLRSDAVRSQIRRSANGVTRFNISKPKLAKTKLPIPPMEYQIEVAKKLDALTSAIDQVSVSIDTEKELLATCLSITRNQILSFPEKAV